MRIARIASIAAFVIAGLNVVSASIAGPFIGLLFAIVPFCAGIGITKNRAWSAYGYSLVLFASLLLLGLLLARPGHSELDDATLFAIAFLLICGTFFFITGLVMSRTGSERGNPLPWIAFSAVCVLPFLFFQAFRTPTGAMEDTILIGDRILVQIRPIPTPHRGDLTVMIYPADRRQTYVKRVEGVPGDRIHISHKAVYVNGALLNEPYAAHKTDYEDSFRDNFPTEPNAPIPEQGADMLARHVEKGELVVPPSQYFVLGDNRDNSFDSRYWGFVAATDLIGKPLFIYDSRDPKG